MASDSMALPAIQTADQFDQVVKENPTRVVVLLCTTCASEGGGLMEECLKDFENDEHLAIRKLDVECAELAPLLDRLNLSTVPAVLFVVNGVVAEDRVVGFNMAELVRKLRFYTKAYIPSFDVKKSLNDRLKELINSSKVMAFIKGSKENPFCRFSKELVSILNETEVPYMTFNVFENEEVREGLKTYSNWPTYPQVYVNGKLIGGVDIIRELKNSGELMKALDVSAGENA